MTRLVIDQAGAVVHDAEAESILVAADDVTLVNPSVDGQWRTENRYGIQTGKDREGFPYKRTRILGGEVQNIWSKGLLIEWARVEALNGVGMFIHDVTQDAIYCGLSGWVDVADVKVRNLGYDPESSRPFYDREGKLIHADGVQARSGRFLRFRRCDIVMHQGYEAEPYASRSGNAGFYFESDYADLDGLKILGNRVKGPNHCIRIRDERWGFHVRGAVVRHNVLEDPWSAFFIDETEQGVEYVHNRELGLVRKRVA